MKFLRVFRILMLALACVAPGLSADESPSPVDQHINATVALGHDDGIFYLWPPPPPPLVNLPPGSSITLVSGFFSPTPVTTFWFKNDRPLPDGQPAERFSIAHLSEIDSAVYHAEVRLPDRTVVTRPATLRVARPIRQQLLNVSTRANINPSNPRVIVGFVVSSGAGERSEKKPFLLRAVGPTLSSVGVLGALADPQIELFDSNNARIPLGEEWAVPAATQAAGANPLVPDNRDAAYVVWLSPGVYSAHIFSASDGSGDVVAEVYDIPEDTWLINPAAIQPPTAF